MTPRLSDLAQSIAPKLPEHGTLGVAVSGGGDSIALLHLVQEIAQSTGRKVEAMTVDHGLRAEAVQEIELARKTCLDLGVLHATARWTGWSGDGNLMGAARQGRYRLISEWAARRKLAAVCIGHTLDDVAETFVMRLGRESGVDGLARMADAFERDGVQYLRPMLHVSRQGLRDYLKEKRVDWCEDPSNENEDFERVRVRRSLEVLQELGITAEKLASVSENMAQVRDVMQEQMQSLAQDIVSQEQGDLIVKRAPYMDAPYELRRRLLNAALTWIVPSDYPLRRATLAELDGAILEGRSFACHGCIIQVHAKTIRILREFNAVRDLTEFAPAWDRWTIEGPWKMGMRVTALGEPALAGVDDWRASGLTRQTVMASPAIWLKDTLIAAPLAAPDADWSAKLCTPDFQSFVSKPR